MQLSIGNAPCSWGVEFAQDPRNPPWRRVLDEAREAGYRGIELGPVGFMPEDPAVLGPALAERGLSLIGGVVFQPFHDPDKWDVVLDTSRRTCIALSAHGARRIVLIDSIAPRRAPTAGRPDEAERMTGDALTAFHGRLRSVAEMARGEYGLEATIHAHAAGYVEFRDELERVLDAIDPRLLSVCLDTGHSVYAGFDPVDFYRRHADRVQGLFAPLALRRALHQLERLAETARNACDVELLLGAEEPEDVGLRDPREAGDLVGGGAVEALLRELGDRCVENLLPPLLLRLPFRCDNHGS